MSNLTDRAQQNIQFGNDIKNDNNAQRKNFKQVFFKPDPNQIKSSPVGVFVKDIYGAEQVKPIAEISGYHTADSCKLNTAIYANNIIDSKSLRNYVPGANEVKMDGDFANSPNYFLPVPSTTFGETFSIEISGYIAAEKPGTYRVSNTAMSFFKKNALIWVGNNAITTYRKENAQFVVENGVQKKNEGFAMVTSEYTPFRIQYSGNTPFDYNTQSLWVNGDGNPISIFAKNPVENDFYYYSLSPSNKTNYYNCHVYKGSELKTYKSDAKQQVRIVWDKPLDENTAYVFLGMAGRLWAYDSNYEKLGDQPLFRVPKPKWGKYNLELYQRNLQPLCIKDARNNVFPLFTIENLNTVKNDEWEKAANPMIKVMTNTEEQVGNKKISKDRISETNPLYSENFRYKLCIMRNSENKKILALLASINDPRQFYTSEPDLKMNKLFYANTGKENKILKEVPSNLQGDGKTYTRYSNMYPVSTSKYSESPYSEANNCEKQCNAQGVNCNHFYKVSNSTGSNCLISNTPVTTYLPKQPDSKYTYSILKIKNKVIKTGDADKDAVYDKTGYISNGYDNTANLRFSDYPVNTTELSETDIPGANGTPDVVELTNNIAYSTNGTAPISVSNINKPMIAGKLERGPIQSVQPQSVPAWSDQIPPGYTPIMNTPIMNKELFTTIVQDSLTKLDQIDSQFKQYKTDQYKVGQNSVDISNNLASIDKTYMDMSGNSKKYDFTGQTIYALEENRTLASAILKDNATYKEEQNNLYMITTLAVATMLVTAIMISK
jgi:hypothetical protein